MSKKILEALNDEINTFNIMIGMSIHETRGTADEKAIQDLKRIMVDTQSKFVEEIERLYYR